MGSIDDIKNKLNLDTLDKDSRKKMFDKFVEKGGQVVEENRRTVGSFPNFLSGQSSTCFN